ncbi:hypothetical protein [Mangrovimonas xylaniphaga]|uniref:hypothetical protein n=1 Tax=Mangrovimonas xylaniphaga TaxID=1645915 RepID=UPI0006B441B7|nr:hypothetical protein [Mangrovimonas xylaniphaga]
MKQLLVLIIPCLLLFGCKTSKSIEAMNFALQETLWTYSDSDWTYQVRFEKNGMLVTSHPNDTSKDNDTWEQHGEEVILKFNDGFSTYTGKMISSNVIEGTAKSKYATWKWRMERIE